MAPLRNQERMPMSADSTKTTAGTPRVSIGLPVYNGERFVGEAIESVLAQTFADFELVISDNASTDGTEAICRGFAARDRRVRYVRAAQNQGAAWNFNRTFELSTGELFKWLAHDDVIGPRYLEQTIGILDRDASLVLCHSQTGVIGGEGEVIADPEEDPRGTFEMQGITQDMERTRLEMGTAPRARQRYLGILLYSIRNYEVFGVIRRSVMQTTGLHRAYRGGEKVFLAELSLRGGFYEIPEVLSFSRWHVDRFSSNASARAQNLHVNPNLRRFALPRQFRATAGYFGAVARTRLSLAERAGCMLVLGRFLLQTNKWKAVLAEYFAGSGQLATLPETVDENHAAAKKHWRSLHGISATSGAQPQSNA